MCFAHIYTHIPTKKKHLSLAIVQMCMCVCALVGGIVRLQRPFSQFQAAIPKLHDSEANQERRSDASIERYGTELGKGGRAAGVSESIQTSAARVFIRWSVILVSMITMALIIRLCIYAWPLLNLGLLPGNYTYGQLLRMSVSEGHLEEAMEVLAAMTATVLHHWTPLSVFSPTPCSVLCKRQCLLVVTYAHAMPPFRFSRLSLQKGTLLTLCRTQHPQAGVSVTLDYFNKVVSLCAKRCNWQKALVVHGMIAQVGMQPDVDFYTSLLRAYTMCSPIQHKLAAEVLDEMHSKGNVFPRLLTRARMSCWRLQLRARMRTCVHVHSRRHTCRAHACVRFHAQESEFRARPTTPSSAPAAKLGSTSNASSCLIRWMPGKYARTRAPSTR